MEILFACAFLWVWGFCPAESYSAQLDKLFLEAPDSAVLSELEECSASEKDTFARLWRYFSYESPVFQQDSFGKALFQGLEAAYRSDVYPIADFSRQCYGLWKTLPEFLNQKEPFFTLNYADEPLLSWGDEQQTRQLYEAAFAFYQTPHQKS